MSIKPISEIIHEGFLAKSKKGKSKMKTSMTGEEVYNACKEQGIYPRISSGVFEGYFDKKTKQKVESELPEMNEEIWQGYSQSMDKDRKEADAARKRAAYAEKKAAKQQKQSEPKPVKVLKVKEIKPEKTEKVVKKIKLINKENPKRLGTAAFEVYASYKDGMTVDKLLEKHPKAMKDLRWDSAKGFIELYE